MGKLTIQEVAKILVEKNGLNQREANQFATECFAVILNRLQDGDAVKVKGLGTFKIINVEARESMVLPLLDEVPENSPEYAKAQQLKDFLKLFKTIPSQNLPPTSLVREFIGGSSFHY